MRSNTFKSALIKSGLAASVFLLASGAAFCQTATVTATTIGSGTVDVGASAPTATLTLTADASSVFDAGIVVVNSIAAPFSVDSGCAGGAPQGGSCTMNVTFSPTATGTLTDSVTVSATSTINPVTSSLTVTPSPVTLSATGISGLAATATTSGNVDVGASLTTLALTLTADSSSVIDAGSVSVTGVNAPFTVNASGCAAGAGASGSCTMNVTFAPTA